MALISNPRYRGSKTGKLSSFLIQSQIQLFEPFMSEVFGYQLARNASGLFIIYIEDIAGKVDGVFQMDVDEYYFIARKI